MKRWGLLAVFGVLMLGLMAALATGFGKDTRAVPFLLKGKPAPDFRLRTLDGKEEISLSQLRGKPVVINVWASWCRPCRADHPVVEWGQQQYGADAQFLGLVFEDTEENALAFLKEMGSSFPQLFDPQSSVAVDYGVAGVPETYFIDAAGIIRDKHVGPLHRSVLVEQMRALRQPALAANTPGAQP